MSPPYKVQEQRRLISSGAGATPTMNQQKPNADESSATKTNLPGPKQVQDPVTDQTSQQPAEPNCEQEKDRCKVARTSAQMVSANEKERRSFISKLK